MLLPPQPNPEMAAEAVLDGLDGLILTGGLDVQPELYGAERHPLTDPGRPDRDAWELALYRGADAHMPCSRSAAGFSWSMWREAARCTSTCQTRSAPSATRSAAGCSPRTPSRWRRARCSPRSSAPETSTCPGYHHQGLDRLGDGLVATARTDDGLVQGVEATADGYLVGVQWHPEQNSEDRRLFAGLVAAASVYAMSRHGTDQPTDDRRTTTGAMS